MTCQFFIGSNWKMNDSAAQVLLNQIHVPANTGKCSRIHWSHPGPHSERRATDPRVVPRKVRFALDAGLSPVWVKSVRNARRESGTGSSDEGHRKRSRGTGPVGSLRTHRSGRPVPVRRLAPEQAQDVHRFLHTLSG
ncbi:hypothetical protein G6F33_005746 [Rhizopus arrhizus]|nr:hypothetical protein G6F23_009949 [Rhizopus arrhizus]KAG0764547.1 hypothetical protein G6F24_005132 [Rhizopus arrhizus]KAG0912809.1 hypothetical protein G6F33_005746 [Rhizopus arrhizus]